MKRLGALACLVVAVAMAPAAADLRQGVAAYARGDFAAAMAQWRPLAEVGDAAAQFHLGGLHENGLGVAKDALAASRWYRRAAEQDHREAAKRLALINFAGGFMWTSKLQAVIWFRRAAGLGDAESQGFMGLIYREGWGVTPDRIAALMWLSLAATNGHAKAADDRRALAATMTAAERAEAARRVRAWPNRRRRSDSGTTLLPGQ